MLCPSIGKEIATLTASVLASHNLELATVIAYHVSSECYSAGQVVQLRGQSRFVSGYIGLDPHNQMVEAELEKARPHGAQSRLTAVCLPKS